MKQTDPISDPSNLLPPPGDLRAQLAQAMRNVDILKGLLRLSENVARRDGRSVDGTDHHGHQRQGVAVG